MFFVLFLSLGHNEDAVRRREVQEQNKSLRSTVDALRTQVENNRVQLSDRCEFHAILPVPILITFGARDFARDREISSLKHR